MHITCNKCNTTFKLPSNLSQFAPQQKVQCSKCKNIWVVSSKDFQTVDLGRNKHPEQENNDNNAKSGILGPINYAEGVSASDYDTHNNTQRASVNISKLQIILSLVLVFVAALLFILTIKYNTATREIVFPNKRHFLLSKVDTSYVPATKTQIITYRISNKSNVSVQLPDVRIKTYDHSGALVHSHIFTAKEISLAPNASALLTTKFTNEESNLHSFSLTIGNDLSFYLDDLLSKYDIYNNIKSLL